MPFANADTAREYQREYHRMQRAGECPTAKYNPIAGRIPASVSRRCPDDDCETKVCWVKMSQLFALRFCLNREAWWLFCNELGVCPDAVVDGAHGENEAERTSTSPSTSTLPETEVRRHRAGFRYYWRWKSRPKGGGQSESFCGSMPSSACSNLT